MKIAFIIYEGMTALDFIGVYDPIARLKTMQFLPELQWEICSLTPNVSDDRGLGFVPTKVSESLSGYDIIIVPGGVVANVQK
ncbi:MAG: hypothetical protein KME30_20300 [Iphinoe sp. HA4291-MV1]|jgi:cyclohexyl-isocyanide hydratase|nr:hypothetical protein [Iphinoe sp. HA4291-MV1]